MKTIVNTKKVIALALAAAVSIGALVVPLSVEAYGWGVYCATPAGLFGPGPARPLGSSCFGYGLYGPVWGYVV